MTRILSTSKAPGNCINDYTTPMANTSTTSTPKSKKYTVRAPIPTSCNTSKESFAFIIEANQIRKNANRLEEQIRVKFIESSNLTEADENSRKQWETVNARSRDLEERFAKLQINSHGTNNSDFVNIINELEDDIEK
jgi:hypothetical protein